MGGGGKQYVLGTQNTALVTKATPSSDWMACTLGELAATDREDLKASAAAGAVLGSTA